MNNSKLQEINILVPPAVGGVVGLTVTSVKMLQPSNIRSPILVTLLGIVILVKLVQRANARYPMEITLFGIVTLVSPEQ